MASAICTVCDGRCTWPGRRGAKLADFRSPCCSAPMRAVRKADGPWTPDLLSCVVCGVAHRPSSRWIYPLRIAGLQDRWAACKGHPAADVERAIKGRYWLAPTFGDPEQVARELLHAYGEAVAREEGVFI